MWNNFICELCTSVVIMTNTRAFAHICGYGCEWQRMLHTAGWFSCWTIPCYVVNNYFLHGFKIMIMFWVVGKMAHDVWYWDYYNMNVTFPCVFRMSWLHDICFRVGWLSVCVLACMCVCVCARVSVWVCMSCYSFLHCACTNWCNDASTCWVYLNMLPSVQL